MVGERHTLVGGELAEGEAGVALAQARRQPHRQAELNGQLDVDVEELGSHRHGRQVGGEVAHVEAPDDGPLDLGAALAPQLVEVGVVPQVFDGSWEPAVAVEQRRCLRHRPPAVQLVLGVRT